MKILSDHPVNFFSNKKLKLRFLIMYKHFNRKNLGNKILAFFLSVLNRFSVDVPAFNYCQNRMQLTEWYPG